VSTAGVFRSTAPVTVHTHVYCWRVQINCTSHSAHSCLLLACSDQLHQSLCTLMSTAGVFRSTAPVTVHTHVQYHLPIPSNAHMYVPTNPQPPTSHNILTLQQGHKNDGENFSRRLKTATFITEHCTTDFYYRALYDRLLLQSIVRPTFITEHCTTDLSATRSGENVQQDVTLFLWRRAPQQKLRTHRSLKAYCATCDEDEQFFSFFQVM
jgi:hypothetical protein